MSSFGIERQNTHRPRLWIVETLVVLGVVAFGYFAVMDTPTPPGAPAATEAADPLLDLLR